MKKNKLRIAIFHLAFLYSGGGERLVLEEALGLRKLGHRVDVYSPIIDYKNCFPELLKKVKVKKLVPAIPSWIPDGELLSILISCIITPFLWEKFRKYDIYFGANQPGPWIAYILSRINKIPYCIYLSQPTRLIHPRLIDQKTGLKLSDKTIFLNIINILFKRIFNFIDVRSITSSPVVFADGSYMKGVLEEVYDIQTINIPAATYIHPAVKNTAFRFNGTYTGKNLEIPKPFALITNRHFPQKKFEYAIEALKLLKKKIPLIIAGKPTKYTKYLQETFNDYPVYFVGLVNEKELERLYKNAAVYLYSSPEEDFGLGIIEAMSYSLPTVAWGNGGPTGIITSGRDGYLAQPFDIKDFSKKIHLLLKNKKLYAQFAREGHKTVAAHFSFSAHNKVLEKHMLQFSKKNR